jgi:polyhydroxybutyrate depolymerase
MLPLIACSTASKSSSPGTTPSAEPDEPTPRVPRDASAPRADGSAPATPPAELSVQTQTLNVDGVSREYVFVGPAKPVANRRYPLFLVFHGDGGNGPGMRTFHPLDSATRADAFVAYPTGLNQSWDLSSPSASNKDIRFVEELVAALKARVPIDEARVFGSGYSSGAFFINKVACRKTGFFRAIISHAGGAPYEDQEPNATTWPGTGFTRCPGQTGGVTALVVHGTKDGTVTPDSGDFSATYWASLNGCQSSRSNVAPLPCLQHNGCPTDKPVRYCLIPGLGHTVWDRGADETWAFVKSLGAAP